MSELASALLAALTFTTAINNDELLLLLQSPLHAQGSCLQHNKRNRCCHCNATVLCLHFCRSVHASSHVADSNSATQPSTLMYDSNNGMIAIKVD
jgi:hypothetical protein